MQKSEPLTVLKANEKEVLEQFPKTISRTVKKHLELLTEPFTVPNGLNAKIKRFFSKPEWTLMTHFGERGFERNWR